MIYSKEHISPRVGLKSHPSLVCIIDRWPCAQHQLVLWVFDWVISLLFNVILHYHTLGFVQYLGFYLTLLVDSSPLFHLSLLVGSEGFCHVLATSCVCWRSALVWLLHVSSSDFFHIIGLQVTLVIHCCSML